MNGALFAMGIVAGAQIHRTAESSPAKSQP